jgi:ribosomal protein S18 acetylase RimI-like enzyme
VDRRLVLRERKRGDLREVQDLEAMAQTRGGGLRRESSSPPVSTQRVDQLDAVLRFGCDEPGVAHELVRSLLENRPHAEATGLPALNLRRESFDGILPRDRLSDGQVPRDRGIAEDLTVPCIEIAHVKWPEPQSLSLDLGHLVSMAVRLRTLPAGLDVGSVAYIPRGYAALVVGDLVVREARPSDARAIAEVSVASRRWSYGDLIANADLEALSVEDATTDFADGLAELSSGAAVFVAELTGRVVGYAYVLPSPDADVPAETSELGSLYVTEEVAGTEVAPALMHAAVEHSRAAIQDVLTLWVRRENGRARRFYEKHGMREDGTERRRPHDVLPTEMNEIRYRMSL